MSKTLQVKRVTPVTMRRIELHAELFLCYAMCIPFLYSQGPSSTTSSEGSQRTIAGWTVLKEKKSCVVSVKPGVDWKQYRLVDAGEVSFDAKDAERPITPEEATALKAVISEELKATFGSRATDSVQNRRLIIFASITDARSAKTGVNIATQVAIGQSFAKGGATVIFTLLDASTHNPIAQFAVSRSLPFYKGLPWDGLTRTNYIKRCVKHDVYIARQETESLIGPLIRDKESKLRR